jgi:hypothetical protein
LKKGDIIIASVLTKSVSGMMLKVLCTDGEGAKCVADVNVKVWELVFIVSLICCCTNFPVESGKAFLYGLSFSQYQPRNTAAGGCVRYRSRKWVTCYLGMVHHQVANGGDCQLHGAGPFFRSCQLCSYSRTSQCFMEPEVSFPRSQEPPTGPCPVPDQSSPYHPILSLKDPF